MEKIYKQFLRELLMHMDNLGSYVDSLYQNSEYSENDLNYIFGVLKEEKLIFCYYADNRAWVDEVTFKGKHYFDDLDLEKSKESQLVKLIEMTQTIEKKFHTVGGKGMIKVEKIYDQQLFQNWINELQYELQKLLVTKEDQYIQDTLELISKQFNGWNDKKDFAQIKSRLMVIKKNKEKYIDLIENNEVKYMEDKEPKIFISHSTKNKIQVEKLVEMFRTIGITPQNIFCSSLPGYDIPIGMNIFEYLRNQFLSKNLYVIFIHSLYYYQSPVSLNEMGAAWTLKSNATSILLPGFGFGDMKGVVNSQDISIKLDNSIIEVKDKLNQLRKNLEKEFSIESVVPDIVWERARDKFIDEIINLSPDSN